MVVDGRWEWVDPAFRDERGNLSDPRNNWAAKLEDLAERPPIHVRAGCNSATPKCHSHVMDSSQPALVPLWDRRLLMRRTVTVEMA